MVDTGYYRQLPREAIRLLVDRISQLNDELNAARQEIARLKALCDASKVR